MIWLLIVIIAHLINALVYLFDKYLLSRPVVNPAVFAFYVGMFSFAAIILIPFGFTLIPVHLILLSLLAGAIFAYGLIPLYYTFKHMDISDAAPLSGAMTPIYTLAFSSFFVPEDLSSAKLLAFGLLVIGGLIIAFRKKTFEKGFLYIQLSSSLFALSFVLTKKVFVDLSFINGLIWTRFGMVSAALSLLLIPSVRRAIFESFRVTTGGSKSLFLVDKTLAGTAFLMILYAIKVGSVSLVNALQGVQYIFLILFVILFAKKFPFMKQEKLFRLGWIQKLTALVFIVVGLTILGLNL